VKGGRSLPQLLEESVERNAERVAVGEAGGPSIDYTTLGRLSGTLRDQLRHRGIGPGDRVGLYLPKSVDSIIAIAGILRAGAAYVPVDPDAPASRCAYILHDCAAKAILTVRSLEAELRSELGSLGATAELLVIDEGGDSIPLERFLRAQQAPGPAPEVESAPPDPDDLAYILYTSGSTGRPKGVMISHRAALTFIDWCSAVFAPTADDVYSSHAPLHFDLSIHDVFVSLKHGARLVLIGEKLGKEPLALAETVAREAITVWYSTPSILSLLARYGRMEKFDYSQLRLVLFAGEVFPIPQLRMLQEIWPHPRYFNLYGPTETNVCTYIEAPSDIPVDRTAPLPIGRVCSSFEARVVDEEGAVLPAGEKGELLVSGPGVMLGYWGLPERNANAFAVDDHGKAWYRTGDLVVEIEAGIYLFHGRRDRMVKRRGYRIELGEIEAGLATHPHVRDVAVVAASDEEGGVRINAYLTLDGDERPSLIAYKRFAGEHLPRYMIPDRFIFLGTLPRTSTDKIDYQALLALA
jgi:amino acid adenylation domain-containing protein